MAQKFIIEVTNLIEVEDLNLCTTLCSLKIELSKSSIEANEDTMINTDIEKDIVKDQELLACRDKNFSAHVDQSITNEYEFFSDWSKNLEKNRKERINIKQSR